MSLGVPERFGGAPGRFQVAFGGSGGVLVVSLKHIILFLRGEFVNSTEVLMFLVLGCFVKRSLVISLQNFCVCSELLLLRKFEVNM